jgi:hypothetical protein
MFAFGFGPGSQLDLFEVNQAGDVFALPLLSFFGGQANPTLISTDMVLTELQLVDGNLLGFLLSSDYQSYLMELLDFSNPYVFAAIEKAAL